MAGDSSLTLLDRHDAVLLDLDGTVYRGGELVHRAAAAVEGIRKAGVGLRFVTNNASKPPEAVAENLNRMGLDATGAEVSTSAQAGAAVLAGLVPAGARVLVVGTAALEAEVSAAGLVPVRVESDRPEAVIQGHSPETGWRDLAEACMALRRGAVWIACNGDTTLPTEHGELPGNGAMVAALRVATGRHPDVAGKPQRPLLDRAVSDMGARAPLMVGDRLDTDIAGAVQAEMPSLMVLTGVGTAHDALTAPPERRPDHIAADSSALHLPAEESMIAADPAWKARWQGPELVLAAAAGQDRTDVAALRTLCAARWQEGSGDVRMRADDRCAEAALRRLGLDISTRT